MSKGDDAVTLEEEHAQAVDEPSTGQLVKPLRVALQMKSSDYKRIEQSLNIQINKAITIDVTTNAGKKPIVK